ncbi:MAG: DUF1559 domain-containing protein [Planctomycetaceae bacterium]|nr:DUF1559 domain-containing protein [Planctomycetaceae bacterium]
MWMLLIVFVVALFLLLIPAPRRAGEAARRTQCKNNFKQILLALHNYHDTYGAFPPAWTVDEAGQRLHSWRTLILPYCEQANLYETIDLSKPWNDPVNRKALETPVAVYRCPSAGTSNTKTSYMAICDVSAVFHTPKSCALHQIRDDTTIAFVEVPQEMAIPWMQPDDVSPEDVLSLRHSNSLSHAGGFQVGFADGMVRFISANIDTATLKSLMTIDGGETVGEF